MFLNNLKYSSGAKKNKKRVGRGIGSGFGKTCGRGHKGQKSRKGVSIRRGFEGGQMPLYRRIPKFGFFSRRKYITLEVRLSEINHLPQKVINLKTLKKNNIIKHSTRYVKIINSGIFNTVKIIRGLKVTHSVRKIIEEFGGKIEE
ncbi:50S ribosomal protein L15 [Buchnera aphidicola]|uniref:50S ribosomal protein L15 n=1 Tax=Buchnera aphidicola TaxID=9 RepID=UPI00346436E4